MRWNVAMRKLVRCCMFRTCLEPIQTYIPGQRLRRQTLHLYGHIWPPCSSTQSYPCPPPIQFVARMGLVRFELRRQCTIPTPHPSTHDFRSRRVFD